MPAKYAPVPASIPQMTRPPLVCQCRKADLYALCHRLPRSPGDRFFNSGILFRVQYIFTVMSLCRWLCRRKHNTAGQEMFCHYRRSAPATKQRDKMCFWSTAGTPERFIRRRPIPWISSGRNFSAVQIEGRIRKGVADATVCCDAGFAKG